jgi:hypothetical protein
VEKDVARMGIPVSMRGRWKKHVVQRLMGRNAGLLHLYVLHSGIQ